VSGKWWLLRAGGAGEPGEAAEGHGAAGKVHLSRTRQKKRAKIGPLSPVSSCPRISQSGQGARARPRRQVGWADGVGAGAAAHRRMVEGAAAVPTAAGHPAAALQVIFLWMSGVCDKESRRLAAWGERARTRRRSGHSIVKKTTSPRCRASYRKLPM